MSEENCNATTGAQVAVLAKLAHRIRTAVQTSQQDRCNALHHDLDAGDALIEAQKRVCSSWKRWLKENCSLGVRTAMLYMQLARHRRDIENEIERVGELSLRGAVRLICAPSKKAFKPKKPDLITAVAQATDAKLTEALITIGLDRFLRIMPADWRAEINARVSAQIIRCAKAHNPNLRLKHLKLVRQADSAPRH
jgi:hypothetical protein